MSAPAVASFLLLLSLAAYASAQASVLECVAWGPEGCLEQELNRALRNAENIPVVRVTDHLSLLHDPKKEAETERKAGEEETTLERLERFLYSHSLRLELPEELVSGARGLVPEEFISKLPTSLTVPLDAGNPAEERSRGFIKKVVLPFVLGLKFKATAVIPIAMALIALKTWKALTLGLLSIVLSAALVIFRLTRPKVLNYEVVYPPSPPHHHIVDDHYHHGRDFGQDLSYRAHRR